MKPLHFLAGLITLAIFTLLIMAYLAARLPVHADTLPRGLGHSLGPNHWYSPQCCNQTDCEAIPFEAVYETPDGYRVDYISARGFEVHELVPLNSAKLKDSQDGRFHACATPFVFYCLYRPVTS